MKKTMRRNLSLMMMMMRIWKVGSHFDLCFWGAAVLCDTKCSSFSYQDIGTGTHGQAKTKKAMRKRRSITMKSRATSLTVMILILS